MAAMKENEGFRGREENHEHVMLIFFPQKTEHLETASKTRRLSAVTREGVVWGILCAYVKHQPDTHLYVYVCTTFSPKLQAQKQHLKKIRKLVFPESRLS